MASYNISLNTVEDTRLFLKSTYHKTCRLCLEPHDTLTGISEELSKMYKDITSIEVGSLVYNEIT